MAMLDGALKNFASRLELSDKRASVVAVRQQLVRARIEAQANFHIEKSLLTGSYARDTQISPINAGAVVIDVDAVVILEGDQKNLTCYWRTNDSGALVLTHMRDSLIGYQGLTPVIDRPCVSLKWSDLTMEVTPAFHRDGGGLLIPDSFPGGGWQHTDPLADAQAMTEANARCNNELKPMIKMLKCWNRKWGKQVSSFAIEAVAYKSASYGYSGYRVEIPIFFGNLLTLDQTDVPTPSFLGKPLSLRLTPLGRQVIRNSKDGFELAYKLQDMGRGKDALDVMGGIFGKPFPGVP